LESDAHEEGLCMEELLEGSGLYPLTTSHMEAKLLAGSMGQECYECKWDHHAILC
jgi:hypothetical protein